MSNELQKYYDQEGYDVIIIEEIQFNDFSIIKCKEWNPVGQPYTYFDIIAKDGQFYNSNFDNIVEINKSCK